MTLRWVLLGTLLSSGVIAEEKKNDHDHHGHVHAPAKRAEFKPTDAKFADIAPIVYARCTPCHRKGGPAPFPLETYEQISAKAESLADAIESGAMPPWPLKQKGIFKEDRSLSIGERDTLLAWLRNGTPAGDLTKAPPIPPLKKADEWEFGEPDLILSAPKYTVKGKGEDEYRTFVIPTNFKEDRYVVGYEYKPGATDVVHHAFSLVSAGANNYLLDAYDLRDPGPGFSSKGTFAQFKPTGDLGAYTPGAGANFLNSGSARLIPKGAKIAMEVHYTPNGRQVEDQTRIGLYFAKEKPEHIVAYEPLWADIKPIPPGVKGVVTESTWTSPPHPINVVTLSPHMHQAGRKISIEATTPEGKKIDLISTDRWDFHNQRFYNLKTPVTIPPGSKVKLTCVFDNDTKKEIRLGFDTADEMCVGYMAYYPEKASK
jgi:hypothetical protein